MLIVRENALASAEGLEVLRQLEHVALDVNRLTDLRGVAGLLCLRTLEAQNNAISVLSNDTFRGCDALERLVCVCVCGWVGGWVGVGVDVDMSAYSYVLLSVRIRRCCIATASLPWARACGTALA